MAEVDMDLGSSLQNLPSNSNKSKMEKKQPKTQEKRIEPVITGEVQIKKKSFFKRFKGSMISEDAHSVGEYVIKEVVLPTVKDLIYNSARGALEIALFGKASGRSGRRNTPYNSLNEGVRYQYNGSSNSSKRNERSNQTLAPENWFNVGDIGFKERMDAERSLEKMRMILEEYPTASVADFYSTLNKTAPYTAENYGWSDLSGVQTYPYKGWFYIDFPEPKPIKNIN